MINGLKTGRSLGHSAETAGRVGNFFPPSCLAWQRGVRGGATAIVFRRLLVLAGCLLLGVVETHGAAPAKPAKSKGKDATANAEYEARLKQLLMSQVATNQSPPPSNAPLAASPSAVPAAQVIDTVASLLASGGTNSMNNLDDKHRLAVGDHLSFRILEDLDDPMEPLEPKQMTVTDSGDIEVPYVGRCRAENKTCKQLAREIKLALEKEYYYQATVLLSVDVMTKSRGRVYLVGPVRAPGPQELPSDEVLTVGKAIMRAGGFGDYADKQHVRITRQGATDKEKQNMVIDVGAIIDKGKTDQDVPLEPGDLIIVPERLIRF